MELTVMAARAVVLTAEVAVLMGAQLASKQSRTAAVLQVAHCRRGGTAATAVEGELATTQALKTRGVQHPELATTQALKTRGVQHPKTVATAAVAVAVVVEVAVTVVVAHVVVHVVVHVASTSGGLGSAVGPGHTTRLGE
jgi:hypothetical protein